MVLEVSLTNFCHGVLGPIKSSNIYGIPFSSPCVCSNVQNNEISIHLHRLDANNTVCCWSGTVILPGFNSSRYCGISCSQCGECCLQVYWIEKEKIETTVAISVK